MTIPLPLVTPDADCCQVPASKLLYCDGVAKTSAYNFERTASAGGCRRYPGDAARRVAGFTMVELLTVITIVGILMAIAAPSYRNITTANRISGEINGLLGDMQYAREEAIREGQNVTVCSSVDGASCSGSTSWKTGWVVFSNPTGATTTTAPYVLRAQKAFLSNDTLNADATSNASLVTWNREGFAISLVATGVVLALHDSTNTASFTRCLTIAMAGTLATNLQGAGGCT